jgi:hypothetical protein
MTIKRCMHIIDINSKFLQHVLGQMKDDIKFTEENLQTKVVFHVKMSQEDKKQLAIFLNSQVISNKVKEVKKI